MKTFIEHFYGAAIFLYKFFLDICQLGNKYGYHLHLTDEKIKVERV